MKEIYKNSTLLILIIAISIISCSKSDDSVPAPKLGDTYKGGIVFYILQPGDPSYIEGETHGFIAYEKDLDTKYLWAQNCETPSKYMLAKLGGLGDGLENTLNIVSGCPDINNAANACNDLGWYLPSLKEMQKLKFNHLLVPNFSTTSTYWTSTIYSQTNRDAFNSSGSTSSIFTTHFVRPIKKF